MRASWDGGGVVQLRLQRMQHLLQCLAQRWDILPPVMAGTVHQLDAQLCQLGETELQRGSLEGVSGAVELLFIVRLRCIEDVPDGTVAMLQKLRQKFTQERVLRKLHRSARFGATELRGAAGML